MIGCIIFLLLDYFFYFRLLEQKKTRSLNGSSCNRLTKNGKSNRRSMVPRLWIFAHSLAGVFHGSICKRYPDKTLGPWAFSHFTHTGIEAGIFLTFDVNFKIAAHITWRRWGRLVRTDTPCNPSCRKRLGTEFAGRLWGTAGHWNDNAGAESDSFQSTAFR